MNKFLNFFTIKKDKSDKESSTIMNKILAVVIAIILWSYVVGEVNPEIVTGVENVNVQLINVEEIKQTGLIVIGEDEFTINVKLRGRRSDLNNFKSEDIIARIDLEGAKQGENSIPVEISVPTSIAVEEILPESIVVKLDNVVHKIKPVEAVFIGDTGKGYEPMKPDIVPSEIMVTGPETFVDSVSKLQVDVNLNNEVTNISETLPVTPVNKQGGKVEGVEVANQYVAVNVPVLRVKEVPINVNVDGVPKEGYKVFSIIKKPAKVTLRGEKDDVEAISSVNATISIEGLYKTTEIPISPQVPNNVDASYTITPPKIKVYIEKIIGKRFEYDKNEIDIVGLGEDYKLTFADQDKIYIEAFAEESKISSLIKADVKLNIDVKNLDEGEHIIKVNHNSVKKIDKLDINPNEISIIIQKKEE